MALNENNFLNRWRRNFLAGLAITMPGVISLAVVVWLFHNVANVTDTLLFFLPKKWTHADGSEAAYWYWSVTAFLLAMFLICLVGRFGRDYLGRRAIKWTDKALLSIPLLNKIYGTVKQVNEAFTSNRSSFKQVVLAPFPHANARCIGFVTGEELTLAGEALVSVFIPTTPIPTSGFMVMFPRGELRKLDMSVPDAIKFIISVGALPPEQAGVEVSPVVLRKS
jgi:uncharacterized membrane protein